MERFWKGVSRLTALDLIFDCVITNDMEAVANEIYDFYSIMPDGNFLLMRNKGLIKDLSYFMECITGGEDTDWESNSDSVYADYTKLEFFRGITVEGGMPQPKSLISVTSLLPYAVHVTINVPSVLKNMMAMLCVRFQAVKWRSKRLRLLRRKQIRKSMSLASTPAHCTHH